MTEVRPKVWRLRAFVGNDPVTGKPRQKSMTVKGGKRAAASALAKFVTEVEGGRVAAGPAMTVAQLLDRWLEHITPQRQPGYHSGLRDKMKRVKATLGTVKLSKLTARHLDEAYRRWLDEGLSPTTVHHCHAVLSAALHQALRWGAIPRVVTDQAMPPPLRTKPSLATESTTVWKLVTAAEEKNQPVLACAIALAAVTGCRRGELCGLRWSDLDLEDGVLYIRRAIKYGLQRSQVITGPTKSHQERKLSLDELTLTLIERHRKQVEVWAIAAHAKVDPHGFILSLDPTCQTPLKPDSLSQAFRRIARDTGVSIRFHDLRHFSATVLVGSGTDVRTVAGRLGHADPSTTLQVYSQVIEAKDRQAATVLGELVAG